MKKKKIPAIIFNDTNFKYPKGLRVKDEDELDTKLKSGKWNTGPVDKKRKPKDQSNPEKKELSDSEKRGIAQKYMDELGEDLKPKESVKDKKEQVPDTTAPVSKKHLSHMNLSELLIEAENIDLTVNENWTKTELYNAIKKKKG